MAGHEPVAGWQDEIASWLPEPEPCDLPPEQVIAWLASPEGERWSLTWHHRIVRHDPRDGIIATVMAPPEAGGRLARWPEPFYRVRV